MKRPAQPYHTDLAIAAGDFDSVAVHYDYQPAERDVNVGESVDITYIAYEDQGDICDDLTDAEMRELEEEVLGHIQQWQADYMDARAEAQYEARREALEYERSQRHAHQAIKEGLTQ